jgi:glucose/arabinose dehydrogenase
MRHLKKILCVCAIPIFAAMQACGSDDSAATSGSDASTGNLLPDGAVIGSSNDAGAPVVLPAACNGSVSTTATALTSLPSPPALTVMSGFKLEMVAQVGSAREMAALPNGDLLVATDDTSVYLVPNAEADGLPGAPIKFVDINDGPTQGITYVPTTCTIYVASSHGIYKMDYKDGQTTGTAGNPIAQVRQGSPAAGSDGDVHTTTSLAFSGSSLYAGVGSGCNACTESDPTRATIQQMGADGSGMTTKATQIRNAIALATNPATGTVWAGGAGQDNLPLGHPYEFFDAVTSRSGLVNYGWPQCEENHTATGVDGDGGDCMWQTVPLVEFPAYSTLIGATFYASNQAGSHVFPAPYKGGLFIAGHGSWHLEPDGTFFSPPRVAYVAMNGDAPATAVDWSDPTKQWVEFIGGWQSADGKSRIARATGIAVGSKGSLFVADDQNGAVYRIRPE